MSAPCLATALAQLGQKMRVAVTCNYRGPTRYSAVPSRQLDCL